jgi:hypothetical protein
VASYAVVCYSTLLTYDTLQAGVSLSMGWANVADKKSIR